MKSKIIALLLSTALVISIIGCGSTGAETTTETTTEQGDDTTASADNAGTADGNSTQADGAGNVAAPATFDEYIASLHAGQAYTYAPVCEGENALLVTSYTFNDLSGHMATNEATIFIEKDGAIEKVTTVQSGGTAYPIAVTEDNSLILAMRNSLVKGYVSKDSGKFVITEEAHINYTDVEDEFYHNYKEGVSDVPTDSSIYDELSDIYSKSEILSFENTGVSSDGSPKLAGAVYAAYVGDALYDVNSYFVFDNETDGHTETTDGVSGLPFTYEQNADEITFHFASADDTSVAKFGNEIPSYPTLTFTGENATGLDKLSLSCLGNADPKTFNAERYYDNDNNLYMQVSSFDETKLTGDLYREERIKEEDVEKAEIGSNIYSINGTQFTVVSFEEVNKDLGYDTDEVFKKDVIGQSRFDGFLLKCTDDGAYYALEKEDYITEYNVVYILNDGNIRKLVEENVTFNIKENCEIILQKFVKDGEFDNLEQEYMIGREFKGDNYPGWSGDADEYYMTSGMLVALGVIDNELYSVVQIYVP